MWCVPAEGSCIGSPLFSKFKFIRPNGLVVRYNIATLAKFILTSGNFFEPETRIAFSDADLKRLDRQIKQAGLALDSVYLAKNGEQQQQRIKDMRFEQNALLGLERCCGELIVEMLHLVEGEDVELEVAELLLLTNLFPQVGDMCKQMQESDANYTAKSIQHFKLFLLGPPNRPTEDTNGLLQVCIDFLDDLSSS